MFRKITRNQLRAGVTALLAAGCCALLAASLITPAASASASAAAAASAGTARAWGIAERIPKLDAVAAALGSAGDAGNPHGGVDLNAVSCTRPGYCTAGGDLYSGSGNQGALEEGWVASEVAGVWAAPKVFNVGSLNFVHSVIVTSVSCASPGNCAAVGYDTEEVEPTGFVDTSGAFVINQVNGRWSAPRQIPGTDALNKQNYGTASSVSCSAPGYCGATGIVDNGTEFVDTETNGVWGRAETVRGFTTAPGIDYRGMALASPVISCPRPGECTVAGREQEPSGATVTSVVTQAGGTWGATRQLPGFAAAGGQVTSLSCRAVGDCSAGGWATSGKHTVPFVASETGAKWTSSAVRGFAALSPATANTGSVTALSCASPGNCSAGGTYQPARPGVGVFFVSEAGGKWQTARPAAGVARTERGISLPSISCPAAGYCAAVVSRAGAGFVAVQSGGTWATARPVAVTTGTGGVTAVSCAAPGQCVAGGNDHAGTEVWVLERSAAASTLTTVAASKSKVSYGAEQAQRITVSVRATTPTPAGRVDVKVDGRVVCTITLRHGTGSCGLTPRQLKPGTYQLTATYRGAAPYRPSTSARKTFKVTG